MSFRTHCCHNLYTSFDTSFRMYSSRTCLVHLATEYSKIVVLLLWNYDFCMTTQTILFKKIIDFLFHFGIILRAFWYQIPIHVRNDLLIPSWRTLFRLLIEIGIKRCPQTVTFFDGFRVFRLQCLPERSQNASLRRQLDFLLILHRCCIDFGTEFMQNT